MRDQFSDHQQPEHDTDRGITAVAGLILLFAIVALGATLVIITGTSALDALEDRSAEERSIQLMDTVRSDVKDVQYGPQTRLEEVWAVEEQGTMTLEVNGNPETQTKFEMGAFIHEDRSGQYASQAGGTWTETDTGSRMIHEPALSHTKTTEDGKDIWLLSLPPVEINEITETNGADGVIAGYEPRDASIEEELFAGLDNNEQLKQISITIEDNPYQDAWARFLKDELPTHRDDSDVEQTPTKVVATAPLGEGLPTPDDPSQYDFEQDDPAGSIVTTAQDLTLTNAYVDSYDSAARSYENHTEEERRHGVIEASGDVTLKGGKGNGQMEVNGDVFAGGSITGKDTIAPGEGTEHWDGYTKPKSAAGTVTDIIAEIRSHRDRVDNDKTTTITDFGLESAGTLESGVYYLEEAAINDELTLDMSDGDVVIAVNGDLTVADDISVKTGESRTNEVRWFVDGNVTVEKSQTVSVQHDRAPQHWVFGTDQTTTRIGSSASFTGAIYTPNRAIHIDTGSQGNNPNKNGRTQVHGGLVGNIKAATNAHFAYDRGLDRDPRAISNGGIGGPNHPFDARVTLAGADFAWSPQIGPLADFLDIFDIVDPGQRDSFDVDLPKEAFEHVEDPDGKLEYFQTASGTMSEVETNEQIIEGTTSSGFLGLSDPSDSTSIDVNAGDTISVTAAEETTELSLVDDGLLFEEDIARGQGRIEATIDETTTLELGISTESERDYELEVEKTQRYEELTFEATEYDEARIEVTSDDSDFYVELRENGEVVSDTDLFSGDARWTAEKGGTISETYSVHQLDIADTAFSGGEATIRIGSLEGNEPIDYEISLEQTQVDSSVLDIIGEPPWFQQFPIETELQFRNATETTTVQPWPETDLEAVSDPPAAHENDVNHPAVEYPLTYEVENLSPGSMFAPKVNWRDGFCSAMNSYAGTWRTPDSGVYEDEVLFEMGCTKEDNGWFASITEPEYDLNRELDALKYVDGGLEAERDGERMKILEDGDEIPDVEPFEAQQNLTQMLGSDIVVENDSTGQYEVRLDQNEFVILFELAPESYLAPYEPTWEDALETGSDAPDFNDMAMLFEITDVHDDVTRFEDSDRLYRYALDTTDGVITAKGK